MRNKKFLKAVFSTFMCSAMALSAFTMSACQTDPENPGGDQNQTQPENPDDGKKPDDGSGTTTPEHQHSYSNEWSKDETHHWHAPTCNDTTELKDKSRHGYVNGKCSECDYSISEFLKVSSDDINNDDSVATYVDETTTPATVAAPKVPTYEGIGGALTEGSEQVTYNFEVAKKLEYKTYSEQWTDGVFTFEKGQVQDRSKGNYRGAIRMDGNAGALTITTTATSGKLDIYAEDGSTSSTAYIVLTKPDGSTQNINDQDLDGVQKISVDINGAGTYKLTRGAGTNYIYKVDLTATMSSSPIARIDTASTGKTEYYVGQQLDCTGVAVTSKHENGKISPVNSSNVQINTEAYNPAQAGTYKIGVKYAVESNLSSDTTQFETEYDVDVYAYDGLELGFDKIVSGKTAAGNSAYINEAVRRHYFVGDTISTEGLSVILKGKLSDKTKDFLLADGVYQVTPPDMTTAGKKTVKISFTTNGITKSVGYNIFVSEKDAALATAQALYLAVNPAFSTETVGVKNAAGAYRFKTLQQAVDFIDYCGISDSAEKTIFLAEGTYWEKIEISKPNISIIGMGAKTTKLEFDSLYGIDDPSGFTHTTDSTQTLAVRDTATGFYINGVTISNAYNSVEYFDEQFGAGYNEHRALAMLIQADKVTIDGCSLLGYQDTVEFFTGRQLIKNSYISGTTDFIFGSNNTTYFYNCEIHSIETGKTNSQGIADGGYVTAFKGCNKGAGDSVTYGAIFDSCRFTADEVVVTSQNTAIARPWGAYAAVAVINSELDGHISKKGFDEKDGATKGSKNQRYVSMSGNKPTDATVKFVEYNNTGDGAISEAVAGMKLLTEEEAVNYTNLTVIFGAKNNNLTYSDVWVPER